MYFYGSEERLIQAARVDRLDDLEARVLKKAKQKKRLQDREEEAFTWPVFETN